mmetsp:Transcript_1794/g.3645  ORF Transcript_1794/g.3645 Transcript_1794/m.3645 type:complete len:207 (-) Transcript_1794:468-1088(-)
MMWSEPSQEIEIPLSSQSMESTAAACCCALLGLCHRRSAARRLGCESSRARCPCGCHAASTSFHRARHQIIRAPLWDHCARQPCDVAVGLLRHFVAVLDRLLHSFNRFFERFLHRISFNLALRLMLPDLLSGCFLLRNLLLDESCFFFIGSNLITTSFSALVQKFHNLVQPRHCHLCNIQSLRLLLQRGLHQPIKGLLIVRNIIVQ